MSFTIPQIGGPPPLPGIDATVRLGFQPQAPSTPAPPPPMPKFASGSGTGNQRNALISGYNDARNRLTTQVTSQLSNCLSWFSQAAGISEADVLAAYDSIEYRFLNLPGNAGAATITRWTPGGPSPVVFIDTPGLFSGGATGDIRLPDGSLTGLSGSGLTALGLLHELGHVLSIFGTDGTPSTAYINPINTKNVLDNCFQRTPTKNGGAAWR